MKAFLQVLLIYMPTTLLYAQTVHQSQTLALDCDENENWLSSLAQKDKSDQWRSITDRFFNFQTQVLDSESRRRLCIPVLVIDGVPLMINDDLSESSKMELSTLLTLDKIDKVMVVDEEPEGLYINKAFSGWIVVTLNDKRSSKKLGKLKLE